MKNKLIRRKLSLLMLTGLFLLTSSMTQGVTISIDIPNYEPSTPVSGNFEPISVKPIEIEALHCAYDGMLDLAPVSAEYVIPELDIDMYDPDFSPISTEFNLDLQSSLKDLDLNPVSTTLDLDLGELGLSSDTLFDYDSSALRPEGMELLQSFFSDFVKNLVSEDRIDYLEYIDFAGHTDSDGTYDYNMQLSLDRAYAVYDYCLSNCMSTLTSEQIERIVEASHVNGYAYTQPVLDASGNEDKNASRRVTIRYYYNSAKISEE